MFTELNNRIQNAADEARRIIAEGCTVVQAREALNALDRLEDARACLWSDDVNDEDIF